MTRTVIESKTKTVVIGFDEPFCVIGERINPTGKPKLKAALRAGDLIYMGTPAGVAALQPGDRLDAALDGTDLRLSGAAVAGDANG